jgi:hypothetical protein
LSDFGIAALILPNKGVIVQDPTDGEVRLVEEFIEARVALLPILIEERGEVDHCGC